LDTACAPRLTASRAASLTTFASSAPARIQEPSQTDADRNRHNPTPRAAPTYP
jgi:hypothetical protein